MNRAPGWAVAIQLLAVAAGATTGPPSRELELIACARELSARLGDSIWPGWSAAPDTIVLVAGDREYLLGTAPPAAGFEPLGGAGAGVSARPRRLAPGLLATLPLFSAEPTIVAGTLAATGKSRGAWTLAVLHEHFHQLQISAPGYFDAVAALELDGGDDSGRWMLDYDFPYGDRRVSKAFDRLARELAAGIQDGEPVGSARRAIEDAARALRASLGHADSAYLAFQLWQEGVARYVELRAAEAAARSAPPCARRLGLNFAAEAARLRAELKRALAEWGALGRHRRLSFYPVGAALALWLDVDQPQWRGRYLADRFRLPAGPSP